MNSRWIVAGLIALSTMFLLTMVACFPPTPSTHLNVARPAEPGEGLQATDPCWSWTGIEGPCIAKSQSLDAPSEWIEIETWMIGQVQPYAPICETEGLSWTDPAGQSISPDDMEDGNFYTFTRIPNAESAGFRLCEK